MDDELKPSPLAYDYEGPGYSSGQMASRLAEPGITPDYLRGQIRRWNSKGQVHANGNRRGTGPRAAHLFAIYDLPVAKILSDLTDLGISDDDVINAASLACYSALPRGGQAQHAIIDAILAWRKLKAWPTLSVDLWRHSQTGERRVTATIHLDLLHEKPKLADVAVAMSASGWTAKASIMLELPPIFERVFADREKLN